MQVPWRRASRRSRWARLASFIPITPGGLGTVDAAMTSLLVAFGATKTDALAATLLWRAASWIPQVLLGVVTLVIWRIKYRGVPDHRRPGRRCGGRRGARPESPGRDERGPVAPSVGCFPGCPVQLPTHPEAPSDQ